MVSEVLFHLAAWRARCHTNPYVYETMNKTPDRGIGADAPIQTASEDRFRRTEFAARIADVLSELSLREGRVFAIRGGWGFGKSSLKNLIIEQLNSKSSRADWLDFNPWQWGDGDAIARALFGQIADRLGGEHSREALDRAKELRRYGAILTGVGKPLKDAGSSGTLISKVLTNASVIAIASAIGYDLPTVAGGAAILALLSIVLSIVGLIFSYLGRDHSGESLDKIRRSLEARLRGLDRPLVVFVDDIDRLDPEQIRMLLRQVKANANLPNIVFVLLFQPSIVEKALNPVASDDGRAFLEKVVQASFDLPAVPASYVHRMFTEELNEIVAPYMTEANGFFKRRWSNACISCIQPLLRNMRDVRRLISSISVHMPLHVVGNVFEVNIIDFLLLETLRVFEPDLHDALFRERGLVLQEESFGQQEASQTAAKKLLEIVSEEHRNIIRGTLKDLFPPFEWAYGGTRYPDNFHHHWLTEKRVCTSRYFPSYFELQTTLGEMSEHRFIDFLDSTATEDELFAAIAVVETDGLLNSLVARLNESTDRLPIKNAAVLLPGMFALAEKLADTDSNPLNLSYMSASQATSCYLKRIPKDVRGDLALEALRKTGALSIASILIHLNDPVDQNKRSSEAFEPALDLNTVSAMKAEWLRLIRCRAADGNALLAEPKLMSLLYSWKDYTDSMDEPRKWMMKAIQTDQGFATVVTRLMRRGVSHSCGDRVSTPHNSFNKEIIDDFIGIDIVKARVDSINPDQFPEHKEALRTLLWYLEKWLGLRTIDTFDL